MNYKETYLIISRYSILLILAFFISIFYSVFTPATVYPVFWILKFFFGGTSLLDENTLLFKWNYIELIPACIAGAAYFLLFILNLTTPMPVKKRIKSLMFVTLVFLALNVARIVIFASLLLVGYKYFDLAHNLFWYFGSTVLIILVWFANVKLFNIKTIPVYSDLINVFSDISKKRRKVKIKRKISEIESLINAPKR